MTRSNVTLREVRASLNPKVKTHYSVRWFGRPVANLVTPLFFRFGCTANGVTLARALIAAVCVTALILPGLVGAIIACFGFYLCFVLDCVDGNLARLRGTVTYWGKFIDGLADFIFILGAPLTAGVGLYVAGHDATWVLAGCLITVTSLTSQMVRSRLSFFREWMTGLSGPLSNEVVRRAAGPRRVQSLAASVYVNGTFLTPLLLLVPDHGRAAFVLAAIGVQAVPEVIWLCATISEARVILARGRKSIHSPPEQSESAAVSDG